MEARENKTAASTFSMLARSLLFMVGAIAWILFVGVTYFDVTQGESLKTEGDWSGLNHVFFLLLSSPFLVPAAFFWGWWIRAGRQNMKFKFAVTAIILFGYGGAYLVTLWNTYPPH